MAVGWSDFPLRDYERAEEIRRRKRELDEMVKRVNRGHYINASDLEGWEREYINRRVRHPIDE